MKDVKRGVETAIERLVSRFKSIPYSFYTEQDMHCFLYNGLQVLEPENGIVTAYGFRAMLIHKEYPTRGRYKKIENNLTVSSSGRRGRYDLSILDADDASGIESMDFRIEDEPLGPLVVVEIALNNYYVTHLRNDLLKITDRRNRVRMGHALIFFRDRRFPKWMGEEDGYIRRIKKECSSKKANQNVPIRFVSVRTEEGDISEITDLRILGGKVVEKRSS